MDHRIDAIQQLSGKLAYVPEHLPVQPGLGQESRAGQAMAEKGGVKTDQFRARQPVTKEPRKDRPDISHISGNQYPHARFNLCCGGFAAPSARRSDLITILVKKKGRRARDFLSVARGNRLKAEPGVGTRIATCALRSPGRRECD